MDPRNLFPDIPLQSPAAPRLRQGRQGMTLLEVLAALAILSIALVTIHQAFSSTVNINLVTEGLWKAMMYTHNELARWERHPSPAVSITQGDFPSDHPMSGYAWLREIRDEEPLPGVKVRKVSLELTWEAAGRKQAYRSEIYVQPK